MAILNRSWSQQGVYARVDSMMRAYQPKVKDADGLKTVLSYIISNFDSDSTRLRASVIWITENIAYDVEMFLRENKTAASLDDILKNKKAICSGYAGLLKHFCDALDIPCEVVSGTARAFDNDIYMTGSRLISNHAWNAVKINGNLRLVDVTWMAGSVGEPGEGEPMKFTKWFNEVYFFTPPEKLILNHFPTESKYQLLRPYVKENDFKKKPLFYGPYLRKNIQTLNPDSSLLKAKVGDTLVFRFKTTDLYRQIVIWSPGKPKTNFWADPRFKGEWVEYRYPVTIPGYYILYLAEVKTRNSEILMAYRLQANPKDQL